MSLFTSRPSVRLSFAVCLLATLAATSFATPPAFVIQSSGLKRLVQLAADLGLPDPVAAVGLDPASTLDRIQDLIKLDSTCAGMIFAKQGQPQFVICLPLVNQNEFLDTLTAIAGRKPTPSNTGAYSIGDTTKLFARQAGVYLLIGDNEQNLAPAADHIGSPKWKSIQDDLRITAGFKDLAINDKAFLLSELMSMISTRPASALALDPAILRDYLRFGMQNYIAQSLFDSWSIDMAVNQTSSGTIKVDVDTAEDLTSIQTPSLFVLGEASHPKFFIDFSSQLSENTVRTVLDWVSKWESDVTEAVQGDHVDNLADLEAVKLLIKLVTQSARQSIENKRLDGFFVLGESNESDYLAAAIQVSNAPALAGLLNRALAVSKQFGIPTRDLRSETDATRDSRADIAIPLPGVTGIAGLRIADSSIVRIQVAERSVSFSLGEEGERLRQLACSGKSSDTPATVSMYCNLGKVDPDHIDSLNVLPFNMRRMKMDIGVTQTGRHYSFTFDQQSKDAIPVRTNAVK